MKFGNFLLLYKAYKKHNLQTNTDTIYKKKKRLKNYKVLTITQTR